MEFEGEKIKEISGYNCLKGKEYAKGEFKDPRRILTTTVRIKNAKYPRIPVRTETGVPKDKLQCCLSELNEIVLDAPIEIGEKIIDNACGTGISVIASRSLSAYSGAEEETRCSSER